MNTPGIIIGREHFHRKIFAGLTIPFGLIFNIALSGVIMNEGTSNGVLFITIVFSFFWLVCSMIYGLVYLYFRYKSRMFNKKYSAYFGSEVALNLAVFVHVLSFSVLMWLMVYSIGF